jgi:type VI secretion system protein ImpK
MAPSLRDLFTPIFSYVLLFIRSPNPTRSFGELQGDLDRLLAEQEHLVKRHEIPRQEYDQARFAVVAWADEAIVSYAHEVNRELAQSWKRTPLQKRLYDTTNAGEEFFDRLAEVPLAQKAVREIYHLCLCLGFRGRYYDESQEHKLVQLRRELAQQRPERIPELLDLERSGEKLSPQPYEVKAPTPRRPARSYAALWALLVSAVLAALVWYLVPSGRTAEEILADLDTRVRGFTCAQIKVGYVHESGMVTLNGHVDGDAQRQQVVAAVRAVPETKEVRDALAIMPHPFCEVVELLQPLQARAHEAGVDLRVTLQRGCDTAYRLGEGLVFSVTAHAPLRHVYIDYYVADREVVGHLYPGGADGDAPLTATALTIGGPGSATQWQVEPPFGMELITVISSPKPLLPPRPITEKAAAYLDALRAALPNSGTSTEVSADYCFITTESH